MKMDYAEKLKLLQDQDGQNLAVGSAQEQAALARFAEFFADFSPSKVDVLLPKTYADDVWFNDTLKTIHGRAALGEYLQHSASAVDACTVQVKETLRNSIGDYFVRWTMTIRFKRFKRGVDTHTIGISHIRFNQQGLVNLHQDYWDSTAGIFEHVPVLGWLIGKIKRKL
jgi:SnoaL-like domain